MDAFLRVVGDRKVNVQPSYLRSWLGRATGLLAAGAALSSGIRERHDGEPDVKAGQVYNLEIQTRRAFVVSPLGAFSHNQSAVPAFPPVWIGEVDINNGSEADLTQLVDLPVAQAIITYRTTHGPFPNAAALGRVPEIDETAGGEIYELIRAFEDLGKTPSVPLSDARPLASRREDSPLDGPYEDPRTNFRVFRALYQDQVIAVKVVKKESIADEARKSHRHPALVELDILELEEAGIYPRSLGVSPNAYLVAKPTTVRLRVLDPESTSEHPAYRPALGIVLTRSIGLDHLQASLEGRSPYPIPFPIRKAHLRSLKELREHWKAHGVIPRSPTPGNFSVRENGTMALVDPTTVPEHQLREQVHEAQAALVQIASILQELERASVLLFGPEP